MRGIHNIWRLVRSGATFERTGAMREALALFAAPPSVRIASRILGWPFKIFGLKGDPAQPPMVRALTALGPAYIKFGQLMSTRPDVVGLNLANELKVLQDRLPPFPTAEARDLIEAELSQPIDALFSEFDDPIAAASIAQVHSAKDAQTGERRAVKVIRPRIDRAFRKDIDAFYLAASMIELLSPATRRLRPRDVVAHFDLTCTGELDLRLEASAASKFAANTEDDQGFYVPRLIWSGTGKSVMTMEWIDGIGLGDVEGLRKAGHNLEDLGNRLITMFLRHALRDGFFHADMHQGNLKIMPNGDIAALDFGIMGRIDEYTRRVYAQILMGFIRRDYRRVAEVHFEAGYVDRDKDVEEFAQALRAVGEPIFGQDASKISMARLLAHLFDVTERFGMETRLELILLQRTMVVVEGVARTLDPKLNIWEVAKPEVESYIRHSLGPAAVAKDLLNAARVLSRLGPKLPEVLEELLFNQREYDKGAGRRSDQKGWGVAIAVLVFAFFLCVAFWIDKF